MIGLVLGSLALMLYVAMVLYERAMRRAARRAIRQELRKQAAEH